MTTIKKPYVCAGLLTNPFSIYYYSQTQYISNHPINIVIRGTGRQNQLFTKLAFMGEQSRIGWLLEVFVKVIK